MALILFELMGSQYAPLGSLGQGTFGTVLLCAHRSTNELVAIKLLPRASVPKYLAAEVLNHSALFHPHVVEFREVFLTRDHICLVMEHVPGGSLKQLIKSKGRLEEGTARWYFQQLLLATDYCHRKGVVNRDIKLENLLLDEDPPLLKVCDFGLSKDFHKSHPDSRVGTPVFMAPEVLTSRGGEYDGKAADVWSCGVVLYAMLYGCHPFMPDARARGSQAEQLQALVRQMLLGQYTLPAEVSLEARDLLHRMLWPDPAQRITVGEVMRLPWFTCGLPAAAATMNDNCLMDDPPEGCQSADEIRRILAEASVGGSAIGGCGGAADAGGGAGSAGAWEDAWDGMSLDDQLIEELAYEDHQEMERGLGGLPHPMLATQYTMAGCQRGA